MTFSRFKATFGRWLRGSATVIALGGVLVGATHCSLLVDTDEFARHESPEAVVAEGTTTDVQAALPEDASASKKSAPNLKAPLDAGVAPATPCDPSALICDDFESGDVSRWSKRLLAATGKVDVVSDFVHHGAFALRARGSQTDAGVKNTATVTLSHTPIASGTFALRTWMFVPKTLLGDTMVVSLGVASSQLSTALRLRFTGDGRPFVVTPVTDGGPPVQDFAKTPFPIGKWSCLEWIVDLGTSGSQKVRVDEQTVVDVAHNTLGLNLSGYDEMRLGIVVDTGTASQDVYFDDVVLGRGPVGCD